MCAINMHRACFQGILILMFSMMICSCTQTRPLQTLETFQAYDYDGMILAGQPDRGLSLAISRSNDDPHIINVFLKNEGERRLCVNSRFLVDCGQYDASSTLFITVIRVSNGERLPMLKTSWTKGGRASRAVWFKYLEPYEYYSVSIDLAEFFDLARTGEQYRVTVEYDNQESGYINKGKWVEMYAWVGRIRSNRLLLN